MGEAGEPPGHVTPGVRSGRVSVYYRYSLNFNGYNFVSARCSYFLS